MVKLGAAGGISNVADGRNGDKYITLAPEVKISVKNHQTRHSWLRSARVPVRSRPGLAGPGPGPDFLGPGPRSGLYDYKNLTKFKII